MTRDPRTSLRNIEVYEAIRKGGEILALKRKGGYVTGWANRPLGYVHSHCRLNS